MIAISYAGVTFASLGIEPMPGLQFEGPPGTARTLQRGILPPLPLGVDRDSRLLTLKTKLADGVNPKSWKTKLHTALGTLDPTDDTERTLVFKLDLNSDDAEETLVQVQASFVSWGVQNRTIVSLTFNITDATWEAQSGTVVGPTNFSANGNLAVNNTGLAKVPALFKVAPITQRTTGETAAVGWKYQAPVVITNDSTNDWHEKLIPVFWGDTTPLTTTKALASGNDVRIWRGGKVIRSELINWDTLATMIVFPVTIPAGKTATYWVVYGNPAASTSSTADPEYLTLETRGGIRPGYAACDLGSTSGIAISPFSTSTIVVTGTPWEVNRWRGGFCWIVSGSGGGNHQVRRIISNTNNTLTLDRNFTSTPDATSVFVVWMSGIAMDAGQPSSATASSLTDSSQSGKWKTQQWKDAKVVIEAGLGIGQTRTVGSSTSAGVLNITSNWSTTPDSTSRYRVIKPGYQTYQVDTSIYETPWRGLWRINNYFTSPEKHWFGDVVPAGFLPFTRYQNEDNFSQDSYANYGSGGGHAENWRPNGHIKRQVRQDRHYANHREADGFEYTDPCGIDGIYFDYHWKNQDGICAFAMGVQQSGSELYSDLVTNSATQSSLTDVALQWVDLTDYGPPLALAMNVGPADGVLIPNDTAFASESEWRTKTRLELWLTVRGMSGRDSTYGYYAVGAEQNAYDLNARLAIGNDIIQFGGPGRHIMVKIGNDIRVRTDTDSILPVIAVYDNTSNVYQETTAWAAQFLESVVDVTGATVERTARRMLALPPGSQNLAISETAMGTIAVETDFTKSYHG